LLQSDTKIIEKRLPSEFPETNDNKGPNFDDGQTIDSKICVMRMKAAKRSKDMRTNYAHKFHKIHAYKLSICSICRTQVTR